MTAFIRQEALEKAREISIKADEEFAIEKSKLVRQEIASIDTSYEKKWKAASLSQQTTQSVINNKSRLRVLAARQELLDGLFEQTRDKLAAVSKDQNKYQKLMKNLILQGLYLLNEPKVNVRASKKDYDVVKKASADASKEYQKNTNKETTIEIDEKNPLPADS